MTNAFDVIIIGGGPGGYVAAIRAAQLGMNVACVEKRGSLGGTCLNVGCIPSKALLESSHKYAEAKHHFAEHGITVDPKLNVSTMLSRKDKVVLDLTKGIEGLFKKNKVTYIKGAAAFTSSTEIIVDGKEKFTAKNFVIATGSESTPLPGVTVDEKTIVTSTGALTLDKIPGRMVVIGGGVIGLEMGSVWARLGTKVTVVEFLDKIGGYMDGEVAKHFQRMLEKQGFEFKLATKVTGAKIEGKHAAVTVEPVAGGASEKIPCDVVLLSIGRRPYTEGLGLDKAGVKLDERGRVATDGHLRTNVANIYAIGDVIVGPMLAHKAEDEGVAVAEMLAGQKGHVYYDAIPGVVYTHPEVANVGKTEEELKAAGVAYKMGKFPFMANSRGRAVGETDGFVKILSDAKTDRLLGCHIIGPDAGTLIHEACLIMEFGGSAEDLARTCHAHPTLNEAVKEAALAVLGRAIHI
jgi:dihydrolipoamide dehydrogenase